MDPPATDRIPPSPSAPPLDVDAEQAMLASVRTIILGAEREQLGQLDQRTTELHQQLQARAETLQQRIKTLEAELDQLEKLQADTDGLIARITPEMTDMISRTIHDSRDEMAEALAPVMGEAIRVQIRDSRNDMIEALYPVIGQTVQRAIAEFTREFQRNIDARLKATFGPEGALRAFAARLRGVSPSDLALRDAMPFFIQEMFLVQRDSGLLVAHTHPGSPEVTDSDLISGMLNAIRDFVRDSFGHGDEQHELDEIQYGDQRIIIQNGQTVYLAVVITGIEPEGFRARLHAFVSELHVRHGKALRKYSGDPSVLPNLQSKLGQLIADTTAAGKVRSKPLSRSMRLGLALSAVLLLLLIGLGCFYVRFTLALWPIAFPNPTSTALPAAISASTSTAVPTLTLQPTATSTPTPLPSFTPTLLPTMTPQPTNTPMPQVTSITGIAIGNVWAHPQPDRAAPQLVVLLKDTPVTVVAAFGEWLEVEWTTATDRQRGWVAAQWISLNRPLPLNLITPTPSR